MIRIAAPKQPMNGVSFYRSYQPLIQLSEHPDFQVTMFDDAVLDDALSEECDVYFTASASYEGQLEIIRLLKKYGRKIVIDYDDSEECHPTNHIYALAGTEECRVELADGRIHEWRDKVTKINMFNTEFTFDIERNKKNREIQATIKREATALTCTTEKLRTQLLQYNPNVFVCPNIIDPNLYVPKPNDNPNEIRVGWAISSGHLDDLVSLKPQLHSVLKENPTMKLVIMCFGLTNEFEEFDQSRIEVVPGVNINKGYHRVFSELKLDMGICHLEDEEFNYYKSPLKWAEYSAMGIPTIASNVMYSDHLKHMDNVYIYQGFKEFRHAVKYMINRPELRKKMGLKAQEDAYKMFGIDAVMPEYAKMFSKVVTL